MPGHPRLIFGAASVGMNFLNPTDVQTLFDALKSAGVTHVDTAGRYPATQPGRSEELLGEVKAAEQGFTIDTKILAVGGDGSGELEKASIERSINKSLERMQIPNVNTLHIHRPDPRTPLEEQAKALNDIYKEGKFKSLGVSQFPPSLLREFLTICDARGYVKPSVYQGDYSAVNRAMEKLLLPLMREHGMVFNAYRTLASGFLSGALTAGNASGTRFEGDAPMNKFMQSLYDQEPLHNAQRQLASTCEGLGISTVEAALRWAYYHSSLDERDGIILGVSRMEQLNANLDGIRRGPLPRECVETFERIWEQLEPERGELLF